MNLTRMACYWWDLQLNWKHGWIVYANVKCECVCVCVFICEWNCYFSSILCELCMYKGRSKFVHNEFMVQYTLYLKSITTIWFINIYNADDARSLQTEHKRNRKKIQEQKKTFVLWKMNARHQLCVNQSNVGLFSIQICAYIFLMKCKTTL